MRKHNFNTKLLRTNSAEVDEKANVRQAFHYAVMFAYDYKYNGKRPSPVRIPIDPDTKKEVENIQIVVTGSSNTGKTSLIK